MTTENLNRVFDEYKEKHKHYISEQTKINSKLRQVENSYTLKSEMTSKLRQYAPKESVEDLYEQVRQLPTTQSVGNSFQELRQDLESNITKIRSKYATSAFVN